MRLNASKTKELLVYFGRKTLDVPQVVINEVPVERVHSAKLLGVTLTDDLSWGEHISKIYTKCSQRVYFLRLLARAGAPPTDIVKIYMSIIRPVLEYACQVWHAAITKEQEKLIENIQQRALRVAFPDLDYSSAMQVSGLDSSL